MRTNRKLITAGGEINMDGPGEKHVTATARPMSQSAKIAAMQNGNYELFDWRQSNQSLNQEYIEIINPVSQLLLTHLAPSTHSEFSLRRLKLNVKKGLIESKIFDARALQFL